MLKPHIQPKKSHMQVRIEKTHKKMNRCSTYTVEETDPTEWKNLPRGSP